MYMKQRKSTEVFIPHTYSGNAPKTENKDIHTRRYEWEFYKKWEMRETKESKSQPSYYKSKDDEDRMIANARFDLEFDKLYIFGKKLEKTIKPNEWYKHLEIKLTLTRRDGDKDYHFEFEVNGKQYYKKFCGLGVDVTYDSYCLPIIDRSKPPHEYLKSVSAAYDRMINYISMFKFDYKNTICGGVCFVDEHGNETSVIKDKTEHHGSYVTEFSIKPKGGKVNYPFKQLIPVLEETIHNSDFTLCLYFVLFENGVLIHKEYIPIIGFNLPIDKKQK